MNTIRLALLEKLKSNWAWYFALGVTLNIVGLLAVIFAYTSTIFSVFYIGTYLMILGVIEGINSFKFHPVSQFILHFMLSALCLFSGIYIISFPLISAVKITLLLAVWLVVSGVLKIIFSFFDATLHKGSLFISGILSLILGVLIWQQWPAIGLYILGMFLGIDMIFMGWNWIALSLAAKNA